jgi:hypothetical protein
MTLSTLCVGRIVHYVFAALAFISPVIRVPGVIAFE